jgi:hypothetical protein
VRPMTDAPASRSSAAAAYSFIGRGHALGPRLDRFHAAIAARASDLNGATVVTDLTLRRDQDAALHRAMHAADVPCVPPEDPGARDDYSPVNGVATSRFGAQAS